MSLCAGSTCYIHGTGDQRGPIYSYCNSSYVLSAAGACHCQAYRYGSGLGSCVPDLIIVFGR